jgi:hypothetical protein
MWSRMCWVCSKTASVYIAKYCVVSAASRSVHEWHIVVHSKEKSLWFRRMLKCCIRSNPKISATYRTHLLLSEVAWDFNFLKPTGKFTFHKVWYSKILHCDHMEFVCFVWISKQIANFVLCNIKSSFMFCWPSIIVGNDQLDTQLLYFTIRLLWSSTYFEHHMLIIRRLNCIDAASGIVTLGKWLSGAQMCTGQPLTENDDNRCCINTIQPPDDEHIMLETCRGL